MRPRPSGTPEANQVTAVVAGSGDRSRRLGRGECQMWTTLVGVPVVGRWACGLWGRGAATQTWREYGAWSRPAASVLPGHPRACRCLSLTPVWQRAALGRSGFPAVHKGCGLTSKIPCLLFPQEEPRLGEVVAGVEGGSGERAWGPSVGSTPKVKGGRASQAVVTPVLF